MSLTARRTVLLTAVVAATALLGRASWGLPRAIGASRVRIRPYAAGSAQFRDGTFRNVLPSTIVAPEEQASLLRALLTRHDVGQPAKPVPLVTPHPEPEAAELAVTWLGHASALLEIDGRYLLVDPVWSERVSPSSVLGPRRLHPVPLPMEQLPPLDAVLISHDHYDHLDLPTVQTLLRNQAAPFVVPLGVGSHLRSWGVPEERIVELDWDQSTKVAGLTLSCTEARHFSGRGLRRNTTLWSSWVIAGDRHRVFFGGDTGYTPAFAAIGARHGPFDLTLLPVGAYGDQWPDIHMTPEEAVRAHCDLNRCDLNRGDLNRGDLNRGDLNRGDVVGRLLLPVHWATFNLAFHDWAEPAERVCAAAAEHGVSVVLPRPGERVPVADPPRLQRWWADGTAGLGRR